MSIMLQSDFPLLGSPRRGKVRDIYDLPEIYSTLGGRLILVATDRISAFDVVLPNGIPNKGMVLNTISALWMMNLGKVIANHLVCCDPTEYPSICRPYIDQLLGRSMLVQKASPLPVECIVRGYLAGSGWKSYLQNQTVCGIQLPPGLTESAKLPEPIFTPSTKAESGHDQNITFEQMVGIVGRETAKTVKTASLALYNQAQTLAEQAGIIIADTKFEFGFDVVGCLILIDEVLTPDSSRFWPIDGYRAGGPQPSFDKQFVRDWLEQQNWDKQPPAPTLPAEVVEQTSLKYLQALQRLRAVLEE
ncbi:MAG: phosphoribosylaminoimidazolesuccinocarboxamide synthase [Patescibacteria group bacterium]|nr:phosphoribosylaminoimidazolesuccinocarboxamide synthase [Patescibacteria group bacterium]